MSKDDDKHLFREQMADVRPLPVKQTPKKKPKPPARARFAREDNKQVLRDSLDGAPHTDSQQEFSFCRPGISRTVMRKLRRGGFSINDELDLHGMNVATARQALDEFIAQCLKHNRLCVRVIHGKGTRSGHTGPVLKPKVPQWLRQRDAVAAFTTARVVDGGSGALYVLLRR